MLSRPTHGNLNKNSGHVHGTMVYYVLERAVIGWKKDLIKRTSSSKSIYLTCESI
jgi:hypothetical protein